MSTNRFCGMILAFGVLISCNTAKSISGPDAVTVTPVSTQEITLPPAIVSPPVGPPIAADGPTVCAPSDIRVTLVRDEHAVFENLSKTCTAHVGFVSFFDPFFDVHRQTAVKSYEMDGNYILNSRAEGE